jgi:hypothetical protein
MICIDPEISCLKNRNWRWDVVTHLFSDVGDLDELHMFARTIGLKKCWFQGRANTPHYDLSPGMRQAAIRAGAAQLTREAACVIFKRNRLAAQSASSAKSADKNARK